MDKEMGIRSSTVLHSIKEMTEAGLVMKTSGGYALTNIGRIQALLLDDLVSSIVTLDEHKDFWLTHDISAIPVDLQKKIGVLTQSEMIASDSIALLRSHEHFIAQLNKAKEIYGISAIIIPGHAETIQSAVKRGAKVELVLTENILKLMTKEFKEISTELLSQINFSLYCLPKDIKLGFTVTDTILSLGLYRLDGGYDLGKDLICEGEKAIAWGMELFEHYRNASAVVKSL